MYQPATGDLVYHAFFKPSLRFIAILQSPLPQSQPHVWFSFHTAEAYMAEQGDYAIVGTHYGRRAVNRGETERGMTPHTHASPKA
jgi:hypothetical protein